MKTGQLFEELVELTEQLGYQVRREKGSFMGSSCVLEGDKIVMLNKNHPVEFNIGVLVKLLAEKDISDIYIKPAVRKEIEKMWKKRGLKTNNTLME